MFQTRLLCQLKKKKKKKHNLKVGNYALLTDLSRRDSLSDNSDGCSEEVREEPGYVGVFAKTKQTNKKIPQVAS